MTPQPLGLESSKLLDINPSEINPPDGVSHSSKSDQWVLIDGQTEGRCTDNTKPSDFAEDDNI